MKHRILIVLIFIAIIPLAINLYYEISEPEFKITKEECVNEKVEWGFYPMECVDFDFSIKSFNILDERIDSNSLEEYLCYNKVKDVENESDKILIRSVGGNDYNETREVFCDYTLSHFEEGQRIDVYENYTVFEYLPENFKGLFREDFIVIENNTICNNNKFNGVYLEVIDYEEVCEDVEVEEMRFRELCNEVGCMVTENNEMYLEENSLTIEWLEDNCLGYVGCAVVNNECLDSCEVVCPDNSKYFCGDYTIEVIK